ncbi:ATP-binding protein [Baaleninema sp.]|uniref:ATP-binding protein n=1 Tax=Baaleninema sp. TaxID=3101197 RepID=UPI003D035255
MELPNIDKVNRIGQFFKNRQFSLRQQVGRLLKRPGCTASRINRRQRYFPVRLSFVLGFGCSAIAAMLVWMSERERAAYIFQKQVHELTAALEDELDHYMEIPQTLGIFYETIDLVTVEKFSEVSTSFLQRYPAIDSLAWIDRVESKERDLYERAIAQPGLSNNDRLPRNPSLAEDIAPLSFWKLNDRGRPISVPVRSEYFPIAHIEPFAQYRFQLGYDELSDRAFEVSPWEQQTVMAIDFEIDDLSSFRVLRGIYDDRSQLLGLLSVQYSIDRLVRQTLKTVNVSGLNFKLFDLTAKNSQRQLLVAYDAETREVTVSSENSQIFEATCSVYPDCTRVLEVAGDTSYQGYVRQWLLVVRPQLGYRQRNIKVEATFGVGLLFTSLVTAYLWMSVRRTIQLEEAKQALERSQAKIYEQAQWERLIDRVASQIRNSLDIDTILNTVVRELRKLLQVDRCSFCWYREDKGSPRWEVAAESRHAIVESDLGKAYSVCEVGLTPESARRLKLCRTDDLRTTSDEVYRSFLRSMGVTSCLTLPIQTQQGALGLVVLVDRESRNWLDLEIESIETVGTQLAIALNQAELYQQTRAKATELARLVEKLQSTQSQLVQTEKMSSLGQLVAGIAHEINNPVNFISGNLSHVAGYAESLFELLKHYQAVYPEPPESIREHAEDIELAFLMEDFPKILASMRVGTSRIQEIVRSMRTFSRVDESDMKAVDLHAGIESTLTILQSRLKATAERPAIAIEKEYGNLPDLVTCYAGLLNQVFMNVLSNGIDALETEYNGEEPTIWISTELQGVDRVVVRIRDNGPGIPPETRERLFDPFFTTKPIGRGTGLGLSISYEIVVEKHSGELRCDSEMGRGTTFFIAIPLR